MARHRVVALSVVLLAGCGGETTGVPVTADGSAGGAVTTAGGASTGGVGGSTQGAAGNPETTECAVTPAAGEWVGAFWEDPYRLTLAEDDSGLSGSMCLGGVEASSQDSCSPVTVLEDRGRKLHILWEPYGAEFDLTLSPARTEMAGRFWMRSREPAPTDDPRMLDAVFVRVPGSVAPAPTTCSAGEPSGECFEAPLAADLIWNDVIPVVDLDGDLLAVWDARRAVETHYAFARFDAASGAWSAPRFVKRYLGSFALPGVELVANDERQALLVFEHDESRLLASHYDFAADAWSEPEVAVDAGAEPVTERGTFLHEAGNATLLFSASFSSWTLLASHYAAAAGVWDEPVIVGEVGRAAADLAGNVVVAWTRSPAEPAEVPWELWFNRRDESGAWDEPAVFYVSDNQILGPPTLAIGPEGTAVAVWWESGVGVAGSFYSLEDGSWGDAAPVVADPSIVPGLVVEIPTVAYTDDGAPNVYAYLYGTGDHLISEFDPDAGSWGAPRVALEDESATRGTYSASSTRSDLIDVRRVGASPDEAPISPIVLGTCAGY